VDEFANYTERFAAEALPAIQNKIGQFTGNPLIRNIIGQPHSSFDFREMMDQKKIVIMNLSKGLIGETNANLLGSMLTTRIYLAAMSRANLPVAEMKQMPNFYFYVDEFQSFANATFANILSEARKYHLNLIIAHQYIEQMEEEVRDAVFGNVGTTIAFRVGPFDAETLETVFTPRFLAADLVNLGFAQIYLTLMIDGIGSQPFSAVTLPPIAPPRTSCKQMVIAASRRNYTSDRVAVEKLVADLHTPTPPPSKVDKRTTTPTTVTAVADNKSVPTKSQPGASSVTTEKKTLTETGGARRTTSVNVATEHHRLVTVTETQTTAPIPENASQESKAPTPKYIAPKTDQAVVDPIPLNNGAHSGTKAQPRTTYKRTGETAKKSPLQMAAATPRQKLASTEDLRAILAKIAKEASAPAVDSKPKEERSEQKNDAPKAMSPLQAALGALSAVSNDTTARELPPRPVSTTNLATVLSPVPVVPPTVTNPVETVQGATQPPASVAATTSTNSSLDPKLIARLLKTPAHDKSPFH